MISGKNKWEKIHSRYGFFLGFCAAVLSLTFLVILTVVLWLPCRWLDQMGISNRQVLFFLSTAGLSQWLYILPGGWYLWHRGWFRAFAGLLCGAGFLLLANLSLIAFVFFFFPRFD